MEENYQVLVAGDNGGKVSMSSLRYLYDWYLDLKMLAPLLQVAPKI